MQVSRVNDYHRTNSIAFKKILVNKIPAKSIENNKYLLLISGPSGVGKDTVMNEIMDKFNKVVTHTTREKRKGEIDGKSYFFTTKEKFLEGVKNNEFLEYVDSFSGNYYGTKKETVEKLLNDKKPALLIVDVDGASCIRNKLKDDSKINVISIFFKPPSMAALKERLIKRSTETVKSIQERLGKAEGEISRSNEYDAIIQVNNLEESVNDVRTLLHLK